MEEHCAVAFHNYYGSRAYCHSIPTLKNFQLEGRVTDEFKEYEGDQADQEMYETDSITALIMSAGIEFS